MRRRTSSRGSSAPRRSTRSRPGSCWRRSPPSAGCGSPPAPIAAAAACRQAAPCSRARTSGSALDGEPESRDAGGRRSSITETIARFGEQVTPLAPRRLRLPGHVRARARAARPLRRRAGASDGRRSVRARAHGRRARRAAARCSSTRGSSPLDRLFSESGAHAQDGRRLLLRRPSGFDLHSVREYEQGESLRKVHWRSTARRGQLMVKELEDAPRDEIAVLLDADASAVVERQLRRAGARGRVDPARARGARPPCRARRQLGGAAERAGHLARRRLAGGPRPARRGASRTARGRWSSCSRARAGRRRERSRPWSSRRACRARSRRSSCSARSPRRASASSGSTRELRGPADEGRAGATAAPGGRRRRRRRPPGRLARSRARRRARRCGAPMVRTRRRLRLPGRADRARLAPARGDARRRAPTGSGSSCSRSLPALAPKLWLRLALVVPAALDRRLGRAATRPRSTTGPASSARFSIASTTASSASTTSRCRSTRSSTSRCTASSCSRSSASASCSRSAIAARRPLPALLVGDRRRRLARRRSIPSRSIAYGAVILAAALWVLAGLRSARRVPALVAGAVLVVAAAGASTSAARRQGRRARRGSSWSTGGPASAGLRQLRLGGHYGGIEFPKKRTTVLRITGPKRGLYWRATTLDQFDSDRWLENPTPLSTGPAQGQAPERPAPAHALAEPPHLDPPGRRGGRAPRHPRRRGRAAGRARRTQPRQRLPPLGRPRPGLQRPQARAELHGLQLRAAARPGRAGPARGRVPAGARPLPRHRPHPRRPVRRPRPRSARGRPVRTTTATSRSGPTRRCGSRRAAAGRRTDALRRGRRDRDLAALDRRLRLRREPTGDGWAAAAGALRRRRQARATASTSPARWR